MFLILTGVKNIYIILKITGLMIKRYAKGTIYTLKIHTKALIIHNCSHGNLHKILFCLLQQIKICCRRPKGDTEYVFAWSKHEQTWTFNIIHFCVIICIRHGSVTQFKAISTTCAHPNILFLCLLHFKEVWIIL